MTKDKLGLLSITLTSCLVGYQLFLPKITLAQAQSLPWSELYQTDLSSDNTTEPPARGRTGGSRGSVCPISPAYNPLAIPLVWSNRPLFMWQVKEGEQIGKFELWQHVTQDVVWSKPVSSSETTLLYDGEALQSGERYYWVLFNENSVPLYRLAFQMVDRQTRDRISSELMTIEAQLQEEGASAEAIAYAKAEYFVTRQMWADVLQQAYNVENPSIALTDFLEITRQQFCSG
ncbi:hypothetical protein MC7420_7998 [Coleofasciculus chthonoplastes PCC 7420]|uniref:DUF928 domain-containing protein n=1 Tax=Coleofasciculus chthonoplastes PCC 7420 TaxID=118168 RepID=B4VJ75_9CYAN|nr:hypothetical protein [Coleofasciculus chthonoplastes]EDX78260.1 hypothetical protein MC7420_7998 [Coleofasciculus chthonoplastes PCC 7420]